MPERTPDRLRRISSRTKVKACPPSPNTVRIRNMQSKKSMERLRAGWNEDKKAQDRENAKLRMQRLRKGNQIQERKPYTERQNNVKIMSAEERKKLKALQRKQQRAYHAKLNKNVVENTVHITYSKFKQQVDEIQIEDKETVLNVDTPSHKMSRKARNASRTIRTKLSKLNQHEIAATVDDVLKKIDHAKDKCAVTINSSIVDALSSYLKPRRGKSTAQKAIINEIRSVALFNKIKQKYLTQKLQITSRRLKRLQDKRGRPKISEEKADQVRQMYEANSRPLPLKRRDGDLDVRVMESTILEVFKKYVAIYGNVISFASFSRLRPTNIRCSSVKDFLSCLCEQCLNVKFKLEAISRAAAKEGFTTFLPKEVSSLHELSKLAICENPTNDCYEQKCLECADNLQKCFLPITSLPQATELRTSWKTWKICDVQTIAKSVTTNSEGKKITETVHAAKKRNDFVRTEGTITDLVSEISVSMKNIPKHLHIADHQQAQRRLLRQNQTPSVVVMDVDYSENIVVKYREEPQSAHYCKPQFTLFPVSVEYFIGEIRYREELLCISDDLTHDVVQSDIFVQKAIDHIINDRGLSPESEFHIFSDRCAAQFSNRTMARFISDRERLTWNFYGVRHGKNLSDTAGANFKTLLTRHILATGDVISDLESFNNFKLPTPLLENRRRTVKTISLDEMTSMRAKYNVSAVPPLTGIKKIHQIISKNDGKICVRHLSCYCKYCINRSYEDCSHASTVGELKEKAMKNKKDESPPAEEDKEVDESSCSKCKECFESTCSFPWLQCCQCPRWFCGKCLPKKISKQKKVFFICDVC